MVTAEKKMHVKWNELADLSCQSVEYKVCIFCLESCFYIKECVYGHTFFFYYVVCILYVQYVPDFP